MKLFYCPLDSASIQWNSKVNYSLETRMPKIIDSHNAPEIQNLCYMQKNVGKVNKMIEVLNDFLQIRGRNRHCTRMQNLVTT